MSNSLHPSPLLQLQCIAQPQRQSHWSSHCMQKPTGCLLLWVEDFLNFTCGRQKTFYQSETHCLIKPSVIRFWQAAQSVLVDSLKIQFYFTFSCAPLKDYHLWWHSDAHTNRHADAHTRAHDAWQLFSALTSFSSHQKKLITGTSRPPTKRQRASRVWEQNI